MGSSWSPPASWCKRFNVDNARLKSERFLAGWVSLPDLLRVIHQFSCSGSILFLTYDRCDLVVQERPMRDKLLHLDSFRPFARGKHDLARTDHGFLCSPSFCTSFSSYGPDDILCLLDDVFWN